MVEVMSNLSMDFDICEHCVSRKSNEVIFSSSAKRVEGI